MCLGFTKIKSQNSLLKFFGRVLLPHHVGRLKQNKTIDLGYEFRITYAGSNWGKGSHKMNILINFTLLAYIKFLPEISSLCRNICQSPHQILLGPVWLRLKSMKLRERKTENSWLQEMGLLVCCCLLNDLWLFQLASASFCGFIRG